MSAASVPAGNADLEAILGESARLVEELARARKVRRLLLLGFLVFVVVTGVMFWRLIERIRSQENIDEIARRVQARLAENSDRYMNEVRLLIDHSTPILTEAFYRQAKQDLPEFMRRAGEQRDLLVANLQEGLTRRMEEHYHHILDTHEKALQEEFPAAQDPVVRERLQTNLGIVFDRLVKRYYGDELRDQLTALYDRWDHFPAADPPGRDEPPLEDQFVGSLLELLSTKLTQPQGAVAAADAVVPTATAPARTLRPREREEADDAPAPAEAAQREAEKPKEAEAQP